MDRAGSSTAYYYGNDFDDIEEYAWFKKNSEEKYHKIVRKEHNKWGLYDMMGNVAEWTMDQYYKDYFERLKLKSGVAINPLFLPNELYLRSLRGGHGKIRRTNYAVQTDKDLIRNGKSWILNCLKVVGG